MNIFAKDIMFNKIHTLIEKEFSSAIDFLNYFNLLEDLWIEDVVASNRPAMDWVFRGQSDSNYQLVPSSFRNPKDDPYDQILSELTNIHLFMQKADEISTSPFPFHIKDMLGQLRVNIFDLKPENKSEEQILIDIPNFPYTEVIEYIALAQHYGIPTRFLDWTDSPFIAAFFAAEKVLNFIRDEYELNLNGKYDDANINNSIAIEHHQTLDSLITERISSGLFPDKISVWAFNTKYTNSNRSPIAFVRTSLMDNLNLKAQSGCFTYYKKTDLRLNDQGSFKCMSEIWDEDSSENTYSGNLCSEETSMFRKITLPTTEAFEVLRLIYRFGIEEASIYPNLENAAKSLKYKKLLRSYNLPSID